MTDPAINRTATAGQLLQESLQSALTAAPPVTATRATAERLTDSQADTPPTSPDRPPLGSSELDLVGMADLLNRISSSWTSEATLFSASDEILIEPRAASESGLSAPSNAAGPPGTAASVGIEQRRRSPDRLITSTAPGQPASIGRFQITSEVARGGMGVILQGWDAVTGRHVAVKILRETHVGNEILVRRFLREARINARLEHPGIIPVHDIAEPDAARPWFAMRLVQGETLAHQLHRRKNTLSEIPRLLRIFEKICHAVGYAHSRKVIHRDLKPGNIMVGQHGIVKVMDWGLAKVLNDPEFADDLPGMSGDASVPTLMLPDEAMSAVETQYGTILGTLAYLPPEQARGALDQIDERADVFSLGAMLCEILTGHPPYTGPSINHVYLKAAEARVDEAWTRLEQCPADQSLVDLTKSCLSPRFADRPANAGAVAEAVTAWLEADLRRAEQDMMRFFDLSLDLFCIAGLSGYFRRINSNFPRVLGYAEEDLISRPFTDFIHPEDLAATHQAMQQLDLGLPVVRFRNRYRHSEGHFLILEWTAKSIPEEGIIYAVARDVTMAAEKSAL